MTDEKESFWRAHLDDTDGALFHFLAANLLDLPAIGTAARELGFNRFLVDCEHIGCEASFMDVFTKAMDLPPSPKANWNTLLDQTRDLSWTSASGYVLIISSGDPLALLPGGFFPTLVQVLEATVRDWRDERGEFGERHGPISFHVIFSGGEILKQALLEELREPLCEHVSELSVKIVQAAAPLRRTATYREAEDLIRSGASPENVMLFLRERGLDELESMYSIAALFEKSIPDARSLINSSRAWSELRNRDGIFRQVARDALRDLGDEDK
jgi:hypothetical protein